MTPEIGFYTLGPLVIGLVLAQALSGRPREGLWLGWLAAILLLPSWVGTYRLGSLGLDLRTAAALAAGLGFLLHPQRGVRSPMVLEDLLVGAMVTAMLATEASAGDLRPLTAPELLRQWVLPYLVGRCFLRGPEDLPRAARLAGQLAAVAGVLAMLEMVTKFNPWNRLLGQHFGLLEAGSGYRWGLKRAHGPCSHPIFFGLAMVLLLPWARLAGASPRGSKWQRAWPWAAGAGIAASLSRGPVLAALGVLTAAFFFRNPRLRAALAVGVLAAVAAGLAAQDAVLQAVANSVSDVSVVPIQINGQLEFYTGTSHRLLLFKAYGPAMDDAGLWGFGNQMPWLQERYKVHSLFWSIDDHYIVHLLQYGQVGVGLFLALTAATLWRLGRLAWRPGGPAAVLAGGLCGAVLAVGLTLLTVYFAPDFGLVWMWTAGLAVNLQAIDRRARAQARARPA